MLTRNAAQSASLVVLACLLASSPLAANAQSPEAGGGTAPSEARDGSPGEKGAPKTDQLLNFGVGIGLLSFLGSERVVDDASIVNGKIRSLQSSASTGIILESHIFFNTDWKSCARCSWGPFAAVQSGDNQAINGFGLGIMFGKKRNEVPTDNTAWNIGIGFMVIPKARQLADGFVDGQAPPAGETQVQFKTKTLYPLMVLVSFSF